MENEQKKTKCSHSLFGDGEAGRLKEDKHFFQELKEETKVYEQTHYVENIKARISQIGNKHPINASNRSQNTEV